MIAKALVGGSGTGKSYRSVWVAAQNDIEYILDDGILVHHRKIIAGSSAKREKTKLAAVKRAIFEDERSRREMREAIKRCEPQGILVLGTSVKMVEKIRGRLELPAFDEILHIEDIASPEEISKARLMRESQGKHVIPVPVMEIRKTFSGYFLDPLAVFRRSTRSAISEDKTIVRPSYSYMGDFSINDTVLVQIARYEISKCVGIDKIFRIGVEKTDGGAVFGADVSVRYGTDIRACAQSAARAVRDAVEKYAAVYTERVNVYIKSLSMK